MCSRMCSLTVRGEQSDVSTFFQEGGKESDVPGVIAELVSAFLRVDSRTCRMRTPGCHTIKKQQHGFAFRAYLAMQLAVRMHRQRGYKYTQPAPRFVSARPSACLLVCLRGCSSMTSAGLRALADLCHSQRSACALQTAAQQRRRCRQGINTET